MALALSVLIVIAVVIVAMYNSLIVKKNAVANVFGTLDAMLQKRHDLIPNLVATVQGYMTHERTLLVDITRLRSQTVNAPTQQRLPQEDEISQTMKQIFAVAENYPVLQASTNFLQLQAAMNEIEEQISAARRAFNAAVTDYNNAVEMFPSSIMAGMMGLAKKPWFEITDEQRRNVNISGQFASK